jgi:uncharacterized membrane protein YhaH (DUF805 family)
MRSVDFNDIVTFFFRANGRIGRVEYFLGAAFIYAVNLAILSFALDQGELSDGTIVLLWLVGVPSLVGVLVVMAKRCHDIGLPGTFVLIAVVPIVGLLWEIALFFIPGTDGPNRYGPAPAFVAD